MQNSEDTIEQQPLAWRQWPLQYELLTSDLEIRASCKRVLRHWNLPSQAASGAVKTFRMHASRNEHGYALLTDFDPEPVLYREVETLVRAAEMNAALALLQMHERVATVHAGLLTRDDHGVVIVGPSQAGKSTLSCALWHAGWQLLADDVAVLDCSACAATPLLRRVSLRDPSRALLGDEFWERMLAAPSCDRTPEGYVFHPDELTAESRARSTPLSAIIFLSRNDAPQLAPAAAQVIDPTRALLAVAPYTNLLQHMDLGATMRRLGPLVHQVPAYDLARGTLPDMIRTVEQLV